MKRAYPGFQIHRLGNRQGESEKRKEREGKKSVIYGGRLLLYNIALNMTHTRGGCLFKNDKHF